MVGRYKILFGLPALLTLCGCGLTHDSDNTDVEVKEYVRVGEKVPVFTVETVNADGTAGTFSTERLTGETVIVLFHTGCGDCQRDLPLLNEYYIQHRGDEGFQMVAISREEGRESIEAFWQEHNLSIPYSPQADRSIYNMFASAMIPRVYFCSQTGTVTRIDVEHYNN